MMRGNLFRGVTAAVLCLASWATASGGQSFTVRSSIGTERFSDPSARDPAAKVKYSPDLRYALIVTTRGLPASNQVESTLWVFDTARVCAGPGL